MDERQWLASDDIAAMFAHLWNRTRTGSPASAASRATVGRFGFRNRLLFVAACYRAVWGRLPAVARDAIRATERAADGACDELELAGGWLLADAHLPRPGIAIGTMAGSLLLAEQSVARSAELGMAPAAQVRLLRELTGNPFGPEPLCWHDGRPYENPQTLVAGVLRSVPPGPTARFDPLRQLWWDRCDWLTADVTALAHGAYDLRTPCAACDGQGSYWKFHGPDDDFDRHDCHACGGDGVADGSLDPVRLGILADAMEEAGCPVRTHCCACGGLGYAGRYQCPRCADRPDIGVASRGNALLEHLRGHGPHHRGCWAVDLLLWRGRNP